MRTGLIALLLLAFQLCYAEVISGRVVGVVDGDTDDILTVDRERVRVRIAGIDAPEKAQAYGKRSKALMSDMAFGKDASVETTKKDRFQRPLGKLMVNGRDTGLMLIEAGMAWHFKKYEQAQMPRDRGLYSAAEDRARAARIGLWQEATPIAPWDWRKGQR